MASKRRLALLMAGTGMTCWAVLVPSVRHAVERASHKAFAPTDRPGVRIATGWTVLSKSTPKIAMRAEPLGIAAPTDETMTPGPEASPPSAETPTETAAPPGPSIAAKDADAGLVRQALDAYRRNDVAAGDAAAKGIVNPLARLTAEWAAVRLDANLLGLARLDAFATAHPDWAARPWLDRRIEEAAVANHPDPASIASRFAKVPPTTVTGKVALADADRTLGKPDEAARLIHATWRDDELTPWQDISIAHDFATVIDREDHRVRAEHFLYKEKVAAGLKEAALAGPDMVLLAKARGLELANSPLTEAAVQAVPKTLQSDPLLLFARIQRLRRADKAEQAADLMLGAPRALAEIIDGDEWWTERRIIVRKLLDLGDPQKAYRLCDSHGEAGASADIEAEFHAGWIALRFLQQPKDAERHFAAIATKAETPISKARAAYWQGRTAEAEGQLEAAQRFYGDAAGYSITFYGQMAAEKLGRTNLVLKTAAPATGDARSEAVQVTDYLYGLGARDIALPLALDIGRDETSDAQVEALGEVLARNRDAWAALSVGKAATQRGLALDDAAFPTFGIPDFRPLPNSADLSVVYAIARQESEFDPKVSSSAGAKGLMQMISSTARSTAQRAGISYDDGRLANDPAFNAQLGAAHLGTLLDEQNGSYVLTFAAYNAGGKAVKDWIAAYGDPRKPGIDMVDWIERIPYSETRNYVQRVMENVAIYRAVLGRPNVLANGMEPQVLARKGT